VSHALDVYNTVTTADCQLSQSLDEHALDGEMDK